MSNGKGFKGFNRDFKCRDLQYEVGKTFTHNGTVSLCRSGLHYCENPLDVLSHYGVAGGNRFAAVSAEGIGDQAEGDSKRVAKTLHIEAEISLSALVGAGIKFVFDKASKPTSGNYANSATNGDYAKASAMGPNAVAASIGPNGATKAALGNWIVCAEWIDGKPINVKSAKVDGKKIKADTFYALKGGKFVEVQP